MEPKNPPKLKGKTSSQHPFWGSMLIVQGVYKSIPN